MAMPRGRRAGRRADRRRRAPAAPRKPAAPRARGPARAALAPGRPGRRRARHPAGRLAVAALADVIAPRGYDDQDLAFVLQPPGGRRRHLEQPARHRPPRPRRAEPHRLRRAHLARCWPSRRSSSRPRRGDARPGQRLGRRPRGRGHHERGGGAALVALPAVRDRLHGAPRLEPLQPGDRARAAQLGGLRPARPGLRPVDEDARVRDGGGGARRPRRPHPVPPHRSQRARPRPRRLELPARGADHRGVVSRLPRASACSRPPRAGAAC